MHRIDGVTYLGDFVDGEIDGQPSLSAEGDDLFDGSDDEDGVIFVTPILAGGMASVSVHASVQGFLNAWVDFNIDGHWAPAEQIFAAEPLVPGINLLHFPVPPVNEMGETFSRWRFSDENLILAPDGTGTTDGVMHVGEVEDHQLIVGPRDTTWDGDIPVGVPGDGISWGDPNNWTVNGVADVLPNPIGVGDDLSLPATTSEQYIHLVRDTTTTVSSLMVDSRYTLKEGELEITTGEIVLAGNSQLVVWCDLASNNVLNKSGGGRLVVGGNATDVEVSEGTFLLDGNGSVQNLKLNNGTNALLAGNVRGDLINDGTLMIVSQNYPIDPQNVVSDNLSIMSGVRLSANAVAASDVGDAAAKDDRHPQHEKNSVLFFNWLGRREDGKGEHRRENRGFHRHHRSVESETRESLARQRNDCRVEEINAIDAFFSGNRIRQFRRRQETLFSHKQEFLPENPSDRGDGLDVSQ